ncbi:MAG: MmcQ/YjbR family DNA-binding protein [Lachnospiraceae bacterium]|nr:MmcQ/YjbR family DNA-binding protein [Lachnospiraceae bacterium]
MRYEWLDEYLLSKKGVTKDLQKDWNWVRYQIGGKMFAAVCLKWESNTPYYITLKLEPAEGEFLRKQYEDIIPGYYMNKEHWNSVKPDGKIPDDLLKDLLDKSYELVLSGFSKKQQRELLGISCCGTECGKCSFYGNMCEGCNECRGKVFHAPKGKACPIYACSVGSKKLRNCSQCEQLPCAIWRNTKDPRLSGEAFEKDIAKRVSNLKN